MSEVVNYELKKVTRKGGKLQLEDKQQKKLKRLI
jgi:hypothetical protein